MESHVELFLSQFLERSGLLAGRIPSMHTIPVWMKDRGILGDFHAWFPSPGIALVENPIHAVCMNLTMQRAPMPKPLYIGGISLGMRGYFSPLLPDILLGFVDDTGHWHWAGGDHGEVLNLHTYDAAVFPEKQKAWPVWFTFGDHAEYRAGLIASNIGVLDLYESSRKDACRKFWTEAKEEFIAATWAPQRLPWCLDHEEYKELFSVSM